MILLLINIPGTFLLFTTQDPVKKPEQKKPVNIFKPIFPQRIVSAGQYAVFKTDLMPFVGIDDFECVFQQKGGIIPAGDDKLLQIRVVDPDFVNKSDGTVEHPNFFDHFQGNLRPLVARFIVSIKGFPDVPGGDAGPNNISEIA